MNLYEIRNQLKTKSIYDIPLRVTFYARVSSDSDEQLNSLENQTSYYENLIRNNQNWTFIPGYIDEGISGISTKKRENFNRMIDDSSADIFDMVITKEISRFARNTLDSIQFTRQLLNNGVCVFFQNDNINTADEDSELRLAIMSSIAQDELRKLSSRVRFGHRQAIKSGVVLGNSIIFGYRKENKKLVIDTEQAKIVKELFELYASGNYSFKGIEKKFWDKGYRNTKGTRISHSTMSGIIVNPKYKGYYVGNKVKTVDMFSKKQIFLPEEEWVMYKDETGQTVPAIVSEELWEQANEVFRKRSNDVKGRQGICNRNNLLTGKLICADCGTPYYRHDSVKDAADSRWVCSGKIKNGADSCKSFAVYESDIRSILLDLFKNSTAQLDSLIEQYTEMYRLISAETDLSSEIKEQEAIIKKAEKKKDKLLDYNIDGQISDSDYIARTKQCDLEIKAAVKKLEELNKQKNTEDELNAHISEIKAVIREAYAKSKDGIISKRFIENYVDRILIKPVSDGKIELEIRLLTGSSTKAYFDRISRKFTVCSYFGSGAQQNQDSRTGVMSKKMIESYEKNMK